MMMVMMMHDDDNDDDDDDDDDDEDDDDNYDDDSYDNDNDNDDGTAGSGSTNPCYYGKEVGVVHVIGLCSYAGFFNGTVQYNWLQNYLNTSIDRERTPWVIVITHVPFYCSNTGHWEEGETHC